MPNNKGQDPQGFPRLDVRAARALRVNQWTLKIDSLMGGTGPMAHFAGKDQFRASLGIDPSAPLNDDPDVNVLKDTASGYLRPFGTRWFTGTDLNYTPLWIEGQPKSTSIFVYDANGSAYTTSSTASVITGLSDGGSLSSSRGNGMAYYDNYMYFAKNTDIARYGPLNGSPAFDGTYWTSTLSKAALTDTTYPSNSSTGTSIQYPNHILHRHSDGKLYILDVVGNQGTLHVISTTKTTVEGDTDNGSKASVLTFGYGLWPTAIESYGTSLVIAFYEGNTSTGTERAKVAFWDTTSQSFNSITWNEYPDRFISSIKNKNGTLYFTSSGMNSLSGGFRVMRYVGGSSFEEEAVIDTGFLPLPGAIDGDTSRLIFGTATYIPETAACVYSLGLRKQGLSKGLFNIARLPGNACTAVFITASETKNMVGFMAGWSAGTTGNTNNAIATTNSLPTDYSSTTPQVFWSQNYRLGQPFKITSIRFSMASTIAGQQIVTPKIYTDENAGNTYTLQTINNTNYAGKRSVKMRSDSSGGAITGDHSFWLELRWTGTDLATIALPIIMQGEYTDDN